MTSSNGIHSETDAAQRGTTGDVASRFYEHVIAERTLGKAVQAGLDGSGIWPHLGAGCHLARDTVGTIAAAGFTVEQVRRFTSGPGPLGLPFVLGTARRKSARREALGAAT